MLHQRETDVGGGTAPAQMVFIASEEIVDAWSSRAGASGEILTFSEADCQNALDAIARRHPHVVVLEQVFATSPRGAAFIQKLQANPDSAGVEIRVLPAERTAALVSSRLTVVSAAASLAALTQPILSRPTRRAIRVRTPSDSEARVDGNPVTVVDLSVNGAQVLSVMILKPNQRVRVLLPEQWGGTRVNGVIAWASFELPGMAVMPRYRAGIEFSDADPQILEVLCSRLHRIAVPDMEGRATASAYDSTS